LKKKENWGFKIPPPTKGNPFPLKIGKGALGRNFWKGKIKVYDTLKVFKPPPIIKFKLGKKIGEKEIKPFPFKGPPKPLGKI